VAAAIAARVPASTLSSALMLRFLVTLASFSKVTRLGKLLYLSSALSSRHIVAVAS
jgi:hypothetical protein